MDEEFRNNKDILEECRNELKKEFMNNTRRKPTNSFVGVCQVDEIIDNKNAMDILILAFKNGIIKGYANALINELKNLHN